MALRASNYFEPEEFKRMRKRARLYHPSQTIEWTVHGLALACRKFGYLGISPHNLIEGDLHSVILVRVGQKLRRFVNPRIEKVSGRRQMLDACANIALVYRDEPVCLHTVVYRPTSVTFSHVLTDGARKVERWREKLPKDSTTQSPLTVLVHEIEHLKGRLIADHARERLVRLIRMSDYALKTRNGEAYLKAISLMPYVLVRKGKRYVLYHGSEFTKENVPEVNPDALFFDHVFLHLPRLFVPRGGKLLRVVPSKLVQKIIPQPR